eukprot:TRINITY_DN2540_c0_g1_i1.p1 TRINITY_DN2540_c0_g1~~TRINITY_DN2540_c0_g1_i1.p1  ORF type:complete len:412 (+),score=71.79 TRINITY_DN2540_c0_g1_i1:138-1373(+)
MEFYESRVCSQCISCCCKGEKPRRTGRRRTTTRPTNSPTAVYVPLLINNRCDDDFDYDSEEEEECPQVINFRPANGRRHRVREDASHPPCRSHIRYFEKRGKTEMDSNQAIWRCVQGLEERMQEMELRIKNLTSEKSTKSRTNVSGKFQESGNRSKRLFSAKVKMTEDVAAVIIQRKFRALLARRSNVLRGLQELAVLKSAFNKLKEMLEKESYWTFLCRYPEERTLFSEKLDVLLLKLESVQGTNRMIRNSRKHLRKELIALMGFLNDMGVNETSCCLTRKSKQHANFEPANDTNEHETRTSNEHHPCTVDHNTSSLPGLLANEDSEEDVLEEHKVINEKLCDWRAQDVGKEYASANDNSSKNMLQGRATKSNRCSLVNKNMHRGVNSRQPMPQDDEWVMANDICDIMFL